MFDANTDASHQKNQASGDDGENYRSIAVTSTPACTGISKATTTTPKMSMLLNKSADIKVGYFGKFEFCRKPKGSS